MSEDYEWDQRVVRAAVAFLGKEQAGVLLEAAVHRGSTPTNLELSEIGPAAVTLDRGMHHDCFLLGVLPASPNGGVVSVSARGRDVIVFSSSNGWRQREHPHLRRARELAGVPRGRKEEAMYIGLERALDMLRYLASYVVPEQGEG